MGRAPKRKRAVLVPKDYQFAGEKVVYLQAMGGVWALFLILAGLVAWQARFMTKGMKPGSVTRSGLWRPAP